MPIRSSSLLKDPFSPVDTSGHVLDPFKINHLDLILDKHILDMNGILRSLDNLAENVEVALYGPAGRPTLVESGVAPEDNE